MWWLQDMETHHLCGGGMGEGGVGGGFLVGQSQKIVYI